MAVDEQPTLAALDENVPESEAASFMDSSKASEKSLDPCKETTEKSPDSCLKSVDTSSVSEYSPLKEESNVISELKESEKQALAELKQAILVAAKAGEFSFSKEEQKKDTSSAQSEGDDKEDVNTNERNDSEESPPTLWGIPLLDGNEMADVVLLKFLRAREFSVERALKMLKNTVHWRKNFRCDEGLINEEFNTEIASNGFYYGTDKQGHPVCYNIIDPNVDAPYETIMRWRVQMMEKGIKMLEFSPHGVSSMLQVVDLKHFRMNRPRFVLRDTIFLLSDNYPELVYKLMLINVPWYYNALYMLASPFLTQRTKNKISIATKGKTSEALFKIISPENVPAQYGGLVSEELFKNKKAPITESFVKPGSILMIEIQVNEGDEVTWNLSVPGWDITYGAEFNPSREGGYTVIVEKPRKIVSQEEEAICNTYKTSSAGSLVLTIDNSKASSNKKKLVVYRYFVQG